MNNRPAFIKEWFSGLIEQADFRVKDISMSQAADWKMVDGAIQHKSGRFFQVVGVEWTSPGGEKLNQPMIEQREIGTLGFLTRNGANGVELLMQAKIEPGNVGIVQLAPTCQATASNAGQVHGGDRPPFQEWFTDNQIKLLDVKQSEQGTRFLGKRNRNEVRLISEAVPERAAHKWLSAKQVLSLLAEDFLINTDARSVLVCSDWQTLAGRPPFKSSNSEFGQRLAASLAAARHYRELKEVRGDLERARALAGTIVEIDLYNLRGWTVSADDIIAVKGGPFSIRFIDVRALGREVPAWHQPIVDSAGTGEIELLCGNIDGVLHFDFRAYREPGLYNAVELGPTVAIPPGASREHVATRGVVVTESKQSEEGGRFFQDVNHYRIVDIGDVPDSLRTPEDFWLTLAQVRELLDEEGWFTNEARSVLSLLLTWL